MCCFVCLVVGTTRFIFKLYQHSHLIMKSESLSPVKDMSITGSKEIKSLMKMMSVAGGFQGRLLGEASDILDEMIRDKKCTRFLSFPADVVATGLRGVLKEMIRRKLFDVVIVASGVLDHDVARTSEDYYAGSFDLDDKVLLKKKFHRLGNVLIPHSNYGPLVEKKIQPFLDNLYNKGVTELSSGEFCSYLGASLNDESSILYWAARNGIHVLVPGFSDGAVGSQTWLFQQRHRDFRMDLMKDETLLSDTVFNASRLGALTIGGGITKHHVLWWSQFKQGLDYAIHITTATEYDGSLSGARTKEAISWSKVKPDAREITVNCDATIALPFITAAVL